ncbi:MAG: hypothetical protein GVY24_05270 [Planctomycetes bacterium]|jgi:hypothetical protein|nr:hypothetical protein [Planctomycetota bacterium]
MRCFLAVLIFTILANVTGCNTQKDSRSEHALYEASCERMAADYRMGRYEKVNFMEMTSYFDDRVGRMTVTELINLLGEPRVVTRQDMYYTHALNIFYDLDTVSDPDWDGGGEHDEVLHYGEYGPPEHRIPDESLNLFFIVKNDVVVGIRTLFP